MNEAVAPAIDCDAAAALLESLTELVIRAGRAILAVDRSAMKVDGKSDGSPVTEADLAADRIIMEGLSRLAPSVPALSEERVALARPPYKGSFFLVDPLDGTKEFVAGRNEFTVNIALVTDGTPLLGIVGAPALGLIWRGIVGRGAERLTLRDGAAPSKEPIYTRPCPPPKKTWTVAVSRSHGDPGRKPSLRRDQARCAPSSARRSSSDGSPRARSISIPASSPTCEWDVAAGHAVVTAAGGKVTDSKGAALRFGLRKDFLVPEFIAWGDPAGAPA